MTIVVTIKRTPSGALKNRKKYPEQVRAAHKVLCNFASTTTGFNDRAPSSVYQFPVITVDKLRTQDIEKLQSYLFKKDFTANNVAFKSKTSSFISVKPFRALSIHDIQLSSVNEGTLSFLCLDKQMREVFLVWLRHKFKDVDIYLDTLHVKQLTTAEIKEKADDLEIEQLIAQEESVACATAAA
ncbi:MAG: hypothetical protein ACI9TY_001722 [Alphaproteobacteria bacterium]|jgi:hypothetical protein